MQLWSHNSENIHRPHDIVLSFRYSIPNTPPTKEDLLCVGEKCDESLLFHQFPLTYPTALRVHPVDQWRFSIGAYAKERKK